MAISKPTGKGSADDPRILTTPPSKCGIAAYRDRGTKPGAPGLAEAEQNARDDRMRAR